MQVVVVVVVASERPVASRFWAQETVQACFCTSSNLVLDHRNAGNDEDMGESVDELKLPWQKLNAAQWDSRVRRLKKLQKQRDDANPTMRCQQAEELMRHNCEGAKSRASLCKAAGNEYFSSCFRGQNNELGDAASQQTLSEYAESLSLQAAGKYTDYCTFILV